MSGRSRTALATLLVGATIAGCRGIVGITDLTAEGDAGAALDATATPDARDAGPGHDTAPPPDAGPSNDDGACAKQTATPCQPCCHDAHKTGLVELRQLGIQVGCICAGDAGDCTTECKTSVCMDPTATGITVPDACNRCLDQVLTGPTCQAVTSQCTGDCKGVLDCEHSCPPP